MEYCVYIHRRKDTKQIFYVGEGRVKYRRPYQKGRRNPHWVNIVNKHGYEIEIWSCWPDQQSAWLEEIKLIAFFNSVGVELTNMTAGGEGRLQHTPSEETRQKISKAGKGRPANHLKTQIKIQFLTGEYTIFPSVSEASQALKVSRRLIRMWQTGVAKPEHHGVQSAIKLPRR